MSNSFYILDQWNVKYLIGILRVKILAKNITFGDDILKLCKQEIKQFISENQDIDIVAYRDIQTLKTFYLATKDNNVVECIDINNY